MPRSNQTMATSASTNAKPKYKSSSATTNGGRPSSLKTAGKTTSFNNASKASFSRKRKAPSEDDLKKQKEQAMQKRARATLEAQRDARHELVVKCNKMWNDLRSKDLEGDKRVQLCTDLFKLLKGKILSFSQRPDTSRVIQSLFKFGDSMVRKAILDELVGQFATLGKGKHSSFLVVTLLRYGDAADRARIASELRENVRSLGSHANGARVVNYCLCGSPADANEDDVITESERKRFYERFYGSDIILLSGKSAGADSDMSLAQYLPEDGAKRSSALQYLKKLVLKMAEKGLLRFPFAQFLCYQLVVNSPREDVCEMIPSVSEAALAMVGTSEGAHAVALCLLAADAKDRKKIIKEWKGHIVDLCAHRFGWYIVARALDSVDDTKMLEKSITEELIEDSEKLKGLFTQDDGFGRKVFLRVLAPESRALTYFEKFPEVFQNDPAGLSTSKKDAEVRNAEVFAKLEDPLFKAIASDAEEMLKNARATDIVRELFARSLRAEPSEAKVEAMNAIGDAALNCLEDAKAHITLKRILKDEAEFFGDGKELAKEQSFASVLGGKLAGKMATLIKVNRPAFVIEALATHPLTKDSVKKELLPLKAKFPKDVKGAEAVLKAISV